MHFPDMCSKLQECTLAQTDFFDWGGPTQGLTKRIHVSVF